MHKKAKTYSFYYISCKTAVKSFVLFSFPLLSFLLGASRTDCVILLLLFVGCCSCWLLECIFLFSLYTPLTLFCIYIFLCSITPYYAFRDFVKFLFQQWWWSSQIITINNNILLSRAVGCIWIFKFTLSSCYLLSVLKNYHLSLEYQVQILLYSCHWDGSNTFHDFLNE